jgi:hypothetical protein
VRVEIDGLGAIENEVVQEQVPGRAPTDDRHLAA